jgi:hypothetical protein
MEHELSIPTTDGGCKTEAQVVHDILSKQISQPTFLQNVGVVHQPSQPCRVKKSRLAAELERDKSRIAELRDIIQIQNSEIDQMASKAREKEEMQSWVFAKLGKLLATVEKIEQLSSTK